MHGMSAHTESWRPACDSGGPACVPRRPARSRTAARRLALLSILWLALAATPANAAFDWSISNVTPNPVKTGCDVTVSGNFRSNQGTRFVHFKKSSQIGSPLTVKSWSAKSIVVSIFESQVPGSGSIVIIREGNQLAKSNMTLQVQAGPCSG